MNSSQNSDQNVNYQLGYELATLSQDRKLNKLLKTVVREVKHYAEDQIKHIRKGAEIGKALSAERDVGKLLEMIVDEARAMSKADAGTLYILSRDKKYLRAKILQNDTMNIRVCRAKDPEAGASHLVLPNVPLSDKHDNDNYSNVSSYVALTGKTVNIPDVYEAEGFDFTGTRDYDTKMGYRSKSMLVIPMKDHENNIIGVLQLLNAQEPDTGKVIPFLPDYVDLIASLASQAAVTLTNTRLIRDLEEQIKRIKRAAEIGKALSTGDNINKLLGMIVDEARDMSGADAGTLYILDKENLHFKILQNDTMGIKITGLSDGEEVTVPDAPFTLPSVPLYGKDGKPNHSHVSSHVALTGETVNIPDVYTADESRGFDFTGPRKYDESTGYRSRSMLVMPLKNHENNIIGVLQLLNAQNETCEVIPFSPEYEDLIASLASQAAVALTNAQLIRDLKKALQTIKDLFYAFIRSIATAIDEKSPYTGGHINRMVSLTMMIARKINETDEDPFKESRFNEKELEELRMAAWMHDVGKITTPEYVLDKKTKLQTIFDRVEFIETRFQLIAKSLENEYLHRKIEILQNGKDPSETEILEAELADKLETLREEFKFIESCNNTGDFMSDEKVEHLKKIAAKTYGSANGDRPYLTDDEVENLCIRKGTLNKEERTAIENHARVTYKILRKLPFPKSMENVPKYASAHHEKLDGSGYPLGLSGDDLPLQARIMVIADIFEALTAKDRPYKKPMTLSEAVRILGFMKKDNHIDPDVFDLFVKNGLHYEYAKKMIDPDLID
ncbi:GAF domain-containing protein [Desulfobacterales bacterium HSG2]|nr:GAF domain-containing protein [Desulfobacterales bacterium HSG2]